jgi:branched-chain amino acid transport system permease protein
MVLSPAVERFVPLVALSALLAAVPWLAGDYRAYQLGLYLLYGIAAQGIALTWGSAGFLSLGQAVFFGLGAYMSGFVLKAAQAQPLAWCLLPLVAIVPGVIAYAIGRLVFARAQASGPYFSLITLALAMLAVQIANQWSSVTGGFNGMGGIPELPHLGRYDLMYWLVAAACVSTTALLAWSQRTPWGVLLRATAQNEARLQLFGLATDRLKATAFAVSGLVAGIAGLLYAPHQGLVTPQSIGYGLSTELVIWAAVGGRAGPYGALLGALAIGLASSELREHFAYWEVLVALVFIAVMLRYPGGLMSALGVLMNRLPKRATRWAESNPPTRQAQTPAPRKTAVVRELAYVGVEVQLGGVRILDGLNLRLVSRGVHCLIGPNGAGKTSSFNVLTGRLALTRGMIFLNGRDVSGRRADTIARLGVGRKLQIPSVFSELSVEQNLLIALWAQRARQRDLFSAASWHWHTPMRALVEHEFVFLRDKAAQPAGELSQGERQMLELSMTLLAEPRVLLLDEPCAGLSPQETRRQMDVIDKAVRALDAMALVIEHDMAAVEVLAQRVHVLHQGRLLTSGTLAEVQAHAGVKAVYAGGRK